MTWDVTLSDHSMNRTENEAPLCFSSHLMTEMETLSILILAWLRWNEVSTLTTSNIEFVRLLLLLAPEAAAVVSEVEVELGSLGIMAATTAAAVGGGRRGTGSPRMKSKFVSFSEWKCHFDFVSDPVTQVTNGMSKVNPILPNNTLLSRVAVGHYNAVYIGYKA